MTLKKTFNGGSKNVIEYYVKFNVKGTPLIMECKESHLKELEYLVHKSGMDFHTISEYMVFYNIEDIHILNLTVDEIEIELNTKIVIKSKNGIITDSKIEEIIQIILKEIQDEYNDSMTIEDITGTNVKIMINELEIKIQDK